MLVVLQATLDGGQAFCLADRRDWCIHLHSVHAGLCFCMVGTRVFCGAVVACHAKRRTSSGSRAIQSCGNSPFPHGDAYMQHRG